MEIKQFYDTGLAHASYALLDQGKIALIDPRRDPQPYYDYAKGFDAEIIAVIETHPHADFVSGHLEIANATGATIYTSKLVEADYPHKGFDEGDRLTIGNTVLESIHTPGHSPDSISILVKNVSGKAHALFTGDTLFIGDVGRPDLRESAGKLREKREKLARMMYHTTREKLMKLPPEVLVYPAHGAGSLCGKNLSDDTVSTIGRELEYNYALQPMSEDEFVDSLLEGQPFIPKYFGYNVDINRKGAPPFQESVKAVLRREKGYLPDHGELLIDARKNRLFKAGHIKGAFNVQPGDKFETWVGSIISPEENFSLVAADRASLELHIRKLAKIGYELLLNGAWVIDTNLPESSPKLDLQDFKAHPEQYTIVDIRNTSEYKAGPLFANSLHRPLSELRENISSIPKDRPIVVHCAGGYRSAIGASILEASIGSETTVYDLSEAVKDFLPANISS